MSMVWPVPADGRCVRVDGTGGEGAAAGVPVVPGAGGVLVWLLAACPPAGAGAEDLHTAGQVPGVRGESCAAAGVRPGPAAGCGRAGGRPPQPAHGTAALTAQAYDMLAGEAAERGRTPVLRIDEAHLLDHAQLESVRMLTNYEMDSRTPFATVLIGQPTLRRMIKLGVLAALDQRIAVRYHMNGMTPEETGGYIRHHLQLAGAAKTCSPTTPSPRSMKPPAASPAPSTTSPSPRSSPPAPPGRRSSTRPPPAPPSAKSSQQKEHPADTMNTGPARQPPGEALHVAHTLTGNDATPLTPNTSRQSGSAVSGQGSLY